MSDNCGRALGEGDRGSKKAGGGQSSDIRKVSQRDGRDGEQWEKGEKQPRGAFLKLLFLVKKMGLDAMA